MNKVVTAVGFYPPPGIETIKIPALRGFRTLKHKRRKGIKSL
jgi:hypothetical protein